MTDLAVALDADALIFDLVSSNDPLVFDEDSGLRTAVLASLFTWRRAEQDDPLPDPHQTDRKGYWGDTFQVVPGRKIGSRLWLLARRVLTDGVVAEAREYAIEALDWLLQDRVVAGVDVIAERVGAKRLNMKITIHRHDGSVVPLDLGDIWETIREAA